MSYAVIGLLLLLFLLLFLVTFLEVHHASSTSRRIKELEIRRLRQKAKCLLWELRRRGRTYTLLSITGIDHMALSLLITTVERLERDFEEISAGQDDTARLQ